MCVCVRVVCGGVCVKFVSCCTRTNFGGTCVFEMIQIQHFHIFIFKDHSPDFVNNYVAEMNFQGVNFTSSVETAKFM